MTKTFTEVPYKDRFLDEWATASEVDATLTETGVQVAITLADGSVVVKDLDIAYLVEKVTL